ncbi:unnamed protein product [Cylindrotheca closterium]|uniref:Uncharacterized protein n=1 Tax=Cylindrotheca closterium TaxID=2856 RepID=A0AAD2FHN3_9STRA|nr:unnamed protein product [Cylindrotheca closterium]
MKVLNNVLCVSTAAASLLVATTNAFVPQASCSLTSSSSTQLSMGLFDNFKTGGSGRDRLDDEWQKQQELLEARRAPKSKRDQYFRDIEARRQAASKERDDKWGWQTKNYAKGEDPLTEWKKRRAEGTISDLNDQYGDPKKVGGIPFPMPSFGVGGEFGVGGKYDNGGRFDLRLPYADQGYVDEDADFMGKLFGKKKPKAAPVEEKKEPEKKKGWFNF